MELKIIRFTYFTIFIRHCTDTVIGESSFSITRREAIFSGFTIATKNILSGFFKKHNVQQLGSLGSHNHYDILQLYHSQFQLPGSVQALWMYTRPMHCSYSFCHCPPDISITSKSAYKRIQIAINISILFILSIALKK